MDNASHVAALISIFVFSFLTLSVCIAATASLIKEGTQLFIFLLFSILSLFSLFITIFTKYVPVEAIRSLRKTQSAT